MSQFASPVFRKRFARRKTTQRPFTFVRNFEEENAAAVTKNQTVEQVGDRGLVVRSPTLPKSREGLSISDIVRQSPVPVLISHKSPAVENHQDNSSQDEQDSSQRRRSGRSREPSSSFLNRLQYPTHPQSQKVPDQHYIGSQNDSNIDEEVSLVDENEFKAKRQKKIASAVSARNKKATKYDSAALQDSVARLSSVKGNLAAKTKDSSELHETLSSIVGTVKAKNSKARHADILQFLESLDNKQAEKTPDSQAASYASLTSTEVSAKFSNKKIANVRSGLVDENEFKGTSQKKSAFSESAKNKKATKHDSTALEVSTAKLSSAKGKLVAKTKDSSELHETESSIMDSQAAAAGNISSSKVSAPSSKKKTAESKQRAGDVDSVRPQRSSPGDKSVSPVPVGVKGSDRIRARQTEQLSPKPTSAINKLDPSISKHTEKGKAENRVNEGSEISDLANVKNPTSTLESIEAPSTSFPADSLRVDVKRGSNSKVSKSLKRKISSPETQIHLSRSKTIPLSSVPVSDAASNGRKSQKRVKKKVTGNDISSFVQAGEEQREKAADVYSVASGPSPRKMRKASTSLTRNGSPSSSRSARITNKKVRASDSSKANAIRPAASHSRSQIISLKSSVPGETSKTSYEKINGGGNIPDQTSTPVKQKLQDQTGPKSPRRFFSDPERTPKKLVANKIVGVKKGSAKNSSASFWKTSRRTSTEVRPTQRLLNKDIAASSVYDDETFGEDQSDSSVTGRESKENKRHRGRRIKSQGLHEVKEKKTNRVLTELDVIIAMLNNTESQIIDEGGLSRINRGMVHKAFVFTKRQLQQTLSQLWDIQELTTEVKKLKFRCRAMSNESKDNIQQKCLLNLELKDLSRRGVDADTIRINDWMKDFQAFRQAAT